MTNHKHLGKMQILKKNKSLLTFVVEISRSNSLKEYQSILPLLPLNTFHYQGNQIWDFFS